MGGDPDSEPHMTRIHPTALIDPAAEREAFGGVLAIDGRIADVGAGVTAASAPAEARIVDCEGDVVSPGLIDMRAFIGEPGAEHRETIASASAAVATTGSNPNPFEDRPVIDLIRGPPSSGH